MLKVNKSFLAMFLFVVLLLSCYTQAYTALLGSTGSVGRTLISIDPATGISTPIGPHGVFGPVSSIKARSDGVLFGGTGGNTGNIITINPITGAETLVGNAGARGINGLEFVGTTLYAAHSLPGGATAELVTIDQNNGSMAVIAPFLLNGTTPTRLMGLAYDQGTSTMYGSTGTLLVTINLTNGFAAIVGSLTTTQWITSLEFDSLGVLYGGDWALGLFTINTASGAATLVGPTGWRMSGLAFLDITDTDGDTLIDLVDTDDDNDGVLDGNDTDPLNPDVCEDVDADTCDDCAIGTDDFGPLPDNDPFNDGLDVSGDGICNAGLPIPAVNKWGMMIFMVLAGLGAVYYLTAVPLR